MKNKKGFTLIELLAVIVILGIILTIATTTVIKNINDSKKKAKYIAARDIVNIAESYMFAEPDNVTNNCVSVTDLIEEEYLEEDVTNPETGENGNIDDSQKVCKDDSITPQEDYEVQNDRYLFDGYYYQIK